MLQVITSNVPYELDWIEGKIDYLNIKIPALSEKNLKYIESGIQDSNYNSSSNCECGKRYLDALRKGKSFSQKPDDDRYIGSPCFWFNAMKTNENICGEKVGFDVYLKGALHCINIATFNGCSRESINKVAEELYKKCNSVKCLRNMLTKPFSSKDTEHIIAIIAKSYDVLKDKNKLSLASKFCSLASEFLFDKVKPFYPRYDNIVAECLGYYISFYLPKNCYKGKYPKQVKNNFKVEINLRSGTAYTEYLKIYEAYSWFIRKILSKISKASDKTQKIYFTASQFTHLIKYADKFKKI
jgi:hypothetical protein